MALSERQLTRRVAVALAIFYPVAVASAATLKIISPRFNTAPWPEIVYGPAITIGFCFLLVCAGIRLECWIRDRA